MYAELRNQTLPAFAAGEKKKFKEYIRNERLLKVQSIPFTSLVKHPALLASFDGLPEITESIVSNGLKTPLTVVRRGDKYAVICGYKRYLAMGALRKNGSALFDDVPCYVKTFEDERFEKMYMDFDNLFVPDGL
ncbi:MAG TPA: ParB N-terminal domain-containing protein [Bacillota bacterium]|nr:ParB N-terminal domain-containing protein [Bacillota bacterium]